MTELIKKLEDRTIREHGFESKITIATFRFTAILKKMIRAN